MTERSRSSRRPGRWSATRRNSAASKAVAVSPDGATVYGINAVDQALVVVNGSDLGQRQFFKDGVDGVNGLAGASAVVVSADGKSVYVTSSDDRRIAIFDRDLSSGDLTYVDSAGVSLDSDVFDTIAVNGDGGALRQ